MIPGSDGQDRTHISRNRSSSISLPQAYALVTAYRRPSLSSRRIRASGVYRSIHATPCEKGTEVSFASSRWMTTAEVTVRSSVYSLNVKSSLVIVAAEASSGSRSISS